MKRLITISAVVFLLFGIGVTAIGCSGGDAGMGKKTEKQTSESSQ